MSVTNKQKSWNNKIETLSNMKGSYESKRQRALRQMRMSGDEWVRAKDELGMMDRDVSEDSIKSTRSKFFNNKGSKKRKNRKG